MFDFEKLKDHPELLDNVHKELKSNKEFVLEFGSHKCLHLTNFSHTIMCYPY